MQDEKIIGVKCKKRPKSNIYTRFKKVTVLIYCFVYCWWHLFVRSKRKIKYSHVDFYQEKWMTHPQFILVKLNQAKKKTFYLWIFTIVYFEVLDQYWNIFLIFQMTDFVFIFDRYTVIKYIRTCYNSRTSSL